MFSDSPKNTEDLIREGYSVDPGQYIGRGWEILKQNLGNFIGFFLICVVISAALGAVPERIRPVSNIIFSIITGPLYAGFYIVALKIVKQRPTSFEDFFRGFNKFLPFFLANLLTSVFIAIGFVLFVIPGIYLAVAYIFTIPFIVDRNLEFWDAMETSRKLVSKRWFSFLGFVLLLVIINLAGLLVFGLGLLITVPLTYCAITAAYERIVGVSVSSALD